jgi:hypothetical protein
MPHSVISDSTLARRVAQAMTSYRAEWQSVDSELQELCRRRFNHEDFEDVYAKVVVIARVYSAGLNRSWKGTRSPSPEVQVSNCLVCHAGLVADSLKELVGQPFDRARLNKIIALHGQLTRTLSGPAGVWLTSFVSKYLHFHCSIVPVYDSQASAHLRRGLVDRLRVRSLQASVAEPEVHDPAYYRFATVFLALYERIYARSSLQPSVKEVDYLLLGNSGQN